MVLRRTQVNDIMNLRVSTCPMSRDTVAPKVMVSCWLPPILLTQMHDTGLKTDWVSNDEVPIPCMYLTPRGLLPTAQATCLKTMMVHHGAVPVPRIAPRPSRPTLVDCDYEVRLPHHTLVSLRPLSRLVFALSLSRLAAMADALPGGVASLCVSFFSIISKHCMSAMYGTSQPFPI
jgi:hypothetical protein